MRRLLLTVAGTKCPFGCSYCFALFKDYAAPAALEVAENTPELLRNIDVLYPACDVDLFALPDALAILWRTARLGRSVSVSTKARLSRRVLRELPSIVGFLRERNCILKIGVSFSTKHRIPEIEPGTAAYNVRIENLRRLRDAGVSSAVVLKPILAELPVDEYVELVEDTSALCGVYLLGDRYLDPSVSDAAGATTVERRLRVVGWVQGRPTWPVEVATAHLSAIKRAIENKGLQFFESDLDLMKNLEVERQLGHGDLLAIQHIVRSI